MLTAPNSCLSNSSLTIVENIKDPWTCLEPLELVQQATFWMRSWNHTWTEKYPIRVKSKYPGKQSHCLQLPNWLLFWSPATKHLRHTNHLTIPPIHFYSSQMNILILYVNMKNWFSNVHVILTVYSLYPHPRWAYNDTTNSLIHVRPRARSESPSTDGPTNALTQCIQWMRYWTRYQGKAHVYFASWPAHSCPRITSMHST